MVDVFSDERQFGEQVRAEYAKTRNNIKKPNILIAGGTGSGKSSLVNMVFSGEQAKVGAGAPVTKAVTKYPGEFVNIFDSPGYESGAESQRFYQETVLNLIVDSNQRAEERIHMAWYCISQGNHRVLEIDTDTINRIQKLGVPIAVILTQADVSTEENSEALKKAVKMACPHVKVFETSVDVSLGLSAEPLLKWTSENIDAAVRTAFVAGAKGAIPLKLAEGKKIVLAFIAMAATIAASPIPFSDAPLLVANQAAMIARLANLWNLPGVQSVAAGGIVGQLATQIGRTLAGNLLKFIPGFGTFAGDAINVAVASSFTGGIGYGVNEICAKIHRDQLDGKFRDISDYLDPGQLLTLFKSKAAEV